MTEAEIVAMMERVFAMTPQEFAAWTREMMKPTPDGAEDAAGADRGRKDHE